jgi:large subunit ribosomal protein L22
MSKPKTQRKLADNEAKAKLSSLRISPQKLGLIAGLIRGKKAQDALVQLTFSRKAASRDVKKLLQSAIANAENNHNLDIDNLVINEVQVGKGLVMKRYNSRARGRGAKILKPFSNISITLREVEPEVKKVAKKAPKAKAATKETTTKKDSE